MKSNLIDFAKGSTLQGRFIIAEIDFNGGSPVCRGKLAHPELDKNIVCLNCWTCPPDKLDVFKKMDFTEIVERERKRLLLEFSKGATK